MHQSCQAPVPHVIYDWVMSMFCFVCKMQINLLKRSITNFHGVWLAWDASSVWMVITGFLLTGILYKRISPTAWLSRFYVASYSHNSHYCKVHVITAHSLSLPKLHCTLFIGIHCFSLNCLKFCYLKLYSVMGPIPFWFGCHGNILLHCIDFHLH